MYLWYINEFIYGVRAHHDRRSTAPGVACGARPLWLNHSEGERGSYQLTFIAGKWILHKICWRLSPAPPDSIGPYPRHDNGSGSRLGDPPGTGRMVHSCVDTHALCASLSESQPGEGRRFSPPAPRTFFCAM